MEDFNTETKELTQYGFINIWAVNPKTGEKHKLCSTKNTILYSGSDLLSMALAGVEKAKISHMYVGYYNGDPVDIAGFSAVDKANTDPMTGYTSGDAKGYIRLPLAYSPSFIGQTNYTKNVPLFTSILTDPPSGESGSATFNNKDAGTPSQIFEVGLAAELITNNVSGDVQFSRARLTDPLTYDPSFNLTITWGVQFTS